MSRALLLALVVVALAAFAWWERTADPARAWENHYYYCGSVSCVPGPSPVPGCQAGCARDRAAAIALFCGCP